MRGRVSGDFVTKFFNEAFKVSIFSSRAPVVPQIAWKKRYKA